MSIFSSSSVASYRVVEELGEVPDGEACRAVDTRSDSPVLLKAIPREALEAEPRLREALAETRRLSRVDRPGIPALYEVSDLDGALLLAFAPTPGTSLLRFVAEGGRVGRARLVDWICQLLGLLAEAHSQEVLHRHLGPDAVVIGEDGSLSLTGFSLTQLAPDAPEFQPPETRGGEGWTAASDLYALGTLFQRLSAPAALGGGAERPLDSGDPFLAVLARATAREPGERFTDAADMELAIRAAAEEAPAAAAPVAPAPAAPEPEVPFATQRLSSDEIAAAEALRAATAGAGTPPAGAAAPRPAPSQPVPSAPPPAPPPPRRSPLPWLAALAAVLLLAAGGWWAWQAGLLPPGKAPQAQEVEAAGTPAGEVREALPPPATPPPPRRNVPQREADALQLARQLVASGGETLFGGVELDSEGQALMADLGTDLQEMGFEDDPRGGQRATSLFGENPLLAATNPLLSRELRERWLAVAIRDMGPEPALAHLTQEAERLARGEVTLAQWYQHVAACTDFCSKVVSGLLYEHVQQVQRQPHGLLLFGNDDDALDAQDREQLWRFLASQPEDARLLLIGRASRSGNRFYNRGLSQRRVEAVQQELLSQGVTAGRIHGFWLGYEPPQLTRRIADLYDLEPALDEGQLNQSVLVVAYSPPPASGAG